MASRLLYCNLTKGTLSTASTGGTTTAGFMGLLKFGDTIKLALRLQKEVNNKLVDANENVQSIKITLGKKDARPVAGYYTLRFSGLGDVTPPIAKNASAEEIQKALNDLATANGDDPLWRVSYINNSYVCECPSGQSYPLEVVENKLTPLSFVTLKAWESDSTKFQAIRLTQAPCAVTTDFALVVPSLPYTNRILGGQYPDELNQGTDEVQSLVVPTEFRGNFQIKRDLAGSLVLGPAVDASVLKEALDSMSKGIGGTYTVTAPTASEKTFTITFGGKLGQSPQPLLSVNVIDAPNGDLTFSLPLATTSLFEAIRDGGGTASLIMEGEGQITEGTSVRSITLFSFPVTITAKLSEPITTALSNVNWAVPPEPSNYIPYSPTQVLFGQQHYEAIIGGNLNKIYDITHNLNSNGNQDIYGVHLTLRENQANGRRLRDDEYTLTFSDNNSLRIATTASWPANSLIATISTAGPRSAFQQHQHSISEITGLNDNLSAIGSQLDQIISVMPAISNMLSTATQATAELMTPINTTFSVLGVTKYKDGKPLAVYGKEEADYLLQAEAWNLDKLPARAPLLYSAVHDSSVEDVTTAPVKGAVNGVYKNTSTKSFKLANGEIILPNEYIGSNGVLVYKVWQPDVAKPSFYPTAYEKTLWQMVSSNDLLSVGRYFQCMFGIGTASYLSNVACKFSVVIEHGEFIEEQSNTYGANLERLSYTHTALSSIVITSPQPQQYIYGVRIKRALVANTDVSPITYAETFTQDKNIAGNWSGASATKPTSPNFAIRAKITMVDIENVSGAQGFIGINLMGNANPEITPNARLELGAKPQAVFATIP